MRTLWYVPVLHTVHETIAVDEDTSIRSLPADMREDHADIMRTWWLVRRALERRIASGEIDPRRLHIFCDGHPVRSGPMRKAHIARSPTYRAILWLQSLGARLHGTESRSFLLMHGLKMMRHLVPKKLLAQLKGVDIIKARDVFVTDRMVRIVPASHDALLFMGVRHRVPTYVRTLAPHTTVVRIDQFVRLSAQLHIR